MPVDSASALTPLVVDASAPTFVHTSADNDDTLLDRIDIHRFDPADPAKQVRPDIDHKAAADRVSAFERLAELIGLHSGAVWWWLPPL